MASPRRPTYKLFSEPMRSETIAQRDALRWIKQEIRECKHNGSTRTELEPLYEKKRALTEARFQARSRLKVVRAEVKSELRRIRAVHRGKEEGSAVASSDDPWEVRIPGMEKLFPAHDSAARQVAVAQASLNLQAEGGNGARQLRQQIDAAMAKSCPGPLVTDFGHLDAVLFGTASQQNILRLLDSIQADDDLLDCCVKQSYHHDLFDKLVLLSGEAHEWKLRMHIFRPEKFTVSQEEVHSHRNHFVSHILHGGFRHELWEPIRDVDTRPDAPDTRELFKYTYDPLVTADGKRVFNIEPGGKVQMKKLDEVEVMSGTTYYMHPSVLHAVTALQGATVTCVLNSPQVHEKSCFATHEPWADETFERVRFTREEVVEAFQLVRELLSAPEEAGGGFVDRGAERS